MLHAKVVSVALESPSVAPPAGPDAIHHVMAAGGPTVTTLRADDWPLATISAGLIENDATPGHWAGGCCVRLTDASTAREPDVTFGARAASVGTVQTTLRAIWVLPPGLTAKGVRLEPRQESPCESVPCADS